MEVHPLGKGKVAGSIPAVGSIDSYSLFYYVGDVGMEHTLSTDQIEAGQTALQILQYLNEEGDYKGRCVLCRSAPCYEDCRIRQALLKAKLISK